MPCGFEGQWATLPLRDHVPKGFGTSVPISLILQGKWLATLSTPRDVVWCSLVVMDFTSAVSYGHYDFLFG
jgi:hypothetical protein